MTRSYPDPWVPRSFTTWVEKHSTRQRGAAGREVDCWDVKGRADAVQWQKRFPRAGLAHTWEERLRSDFAAGLPSTFDPASSSRPSPP